MKKMLLLLGIGLAVLLLLPLLIGLFLPAQRSFIRTHTLQAPINVVFAMVTDLKGQESWRSDLQSIEILDDTYGQEVWLETPKGQLPIRFKSLQKIENQRYEMALEGKGFQGHWLGIFESTPANGTKVTFKETATIANPYLRTFAYFFVDLNQTMDIYLRDLATKLGESYEN
ncbi:MAG: SRPBCC family protein [Saprospiraceae bacterium]